MPLLTKTQLAEEVKQLQEKEGGKGRRKNICKLRSLIGRMNVYQRKIECKQFEKKIGRKMWNIQRVQFKFASASKKD